MQAGIRSKLFAISVALISIVGLTSGLYLQRELRQWLEKRIEAELSRQAHGASELASSLAEALPKTLPETLPERAPGASWIYRLDAFADRLSLAFDSRVTIIARDGAVLGDSDLTAAQVATIDNHGQRDEVRQARATGHGRSRRYSTTLHTDMMYVAALCPNGRCVVRVARALSEVDAAVGRLRALLGFAGLLGLVIAVVMSGLASHYMSRTLRQLADSARALAGTATRSAPGRRARIGVTSADEIGRLAGSLNRMADDIAATITALASQRTRFEAVLESMREGVIALDAEGRIQLINGAAVQLLDIDQISAQETVGKPLVDYLRAPGIHEALATGQPSATCELGLPGPRSRQVWARIVLEASGSGCVIVMHDVTEIRRLESMRRDFVANLSHELRTPVTVIRANVETLLDGAKDDAVHGTRLLEALHRNAERLSSLVSDLLDLSRIEAGGYAIGQEPVELRAAAQEAIAAMERAAQERRIELTNQVGAALCAAGDQKALDQILVNYLDNAIKYTPEGGKVAVEAHARGEHVRIEVIDNGPGIPTHLHGRVFERFYRVDAGRSRAMGGTGLGLAIVKNLAEAMDGKAGVDRVEPHGSCFWVSLPRAGRPRG